MQHFHAAFLTLFWLLRRASIKRKNLVGSNLLPQCLLRNKTKGWLQLWSLQIKFCERKGHWNKCYWANRPVLLSVWSATFFLPFCKLYLYKCIYKGVNNVVHMNKKIKLPRDNDLTSPIKWSLTNKNYTIYFVSPNSVITFVQIEVNKHL